MLQAIMNGKNDSYILKSSLSEMRGFLLPEKEAPPQRGAF
jgi:hypothetical protein